MTSPWKEELNARPVHFDCARQLKSNNNFILGGAMLDDAGKMIGSTMVVQFETEEGLKEWLEKEPYIKSRVWEKFEVRPFRVAGV